MIDKFFTRLYQALEAWPLNFPTIEKICAPLCNRVPRSGRMSSGSDVERGFDPAFEQVGGGQLGLHREDDGQQVGPSGLMAGAMPVSPSPLIRLRFTRTACIKTARCV